MGNFDRNRNSRPSGGRSFERRGFNDRGSRGPVEMHQAVCDNCRKSCEVPFRPTSGKPIFCSACFENNRGSEPRPSYGRENSEDRPMFEAVCDECRTNCKVPFQPSGDKPVFCSNCFGDKKNAGGDSRNSAPAQSQHKELFESLNNKLDKIITLLSPVAAKEVIVEEVVEKVAEPKKAKAKKSPAKKK